MSSEVTRFQVVRAPQRQCPRVQGRPVLRLDAWLVESALPDRLLAAQEDAARDMAVSVVPVVDPAGPPLTSVADTGVPQCEALARLDSWLLCGDNRATPEEVRAAVHRFFDRDPVEQEVDGSADPPSIPVGDGLYPTALALAEQLVALAHVDAEPTTQLVVQRAVLVLGLVELVLFNDGVLRLPEDVLWALRDRIVLLPHKLFPRPVRAALVRKPGFADLYVVRQEWNRYVSGELAHIENILAHEMKERVLTRLDETESTLMVSTERGETQERDNQSTARFELSQESSELTASKVHLEGQVDTSGQYGPTQVTTHLGGSLDFSAEESTRQALRQATELVNRAVHRVEERVSEQRTTRTLTRTESKDTHQVKAEDASVCGMYRWVDKVVRLRTYRYPHRFLLEFEIPEPAAYVRWWDKRGTSEGYDTPEPTPFTLSGNPAEEHPAALLPTDISENPADPGYYLELAARWHAVGITAPPADEVVAHGYLHVPQTDPSGDKTSHDVWLTPLEGSTSGTGGVEGAPVTVPPGYRAEDRWSGWVVAWDQDDWVKPGWNTSDYSSCDIVPPAAVITVGDSANVPPESDPDPVKNRVIAWGERSWISKPIGGQLDGRRTGKLPITVLAANYGLFSVQVRVVCRREEAALREWRATTYEKLRTAYFELLRAHRQERDERAVRAGIRIEGRSPAENARVMREEIKRQVVELLLGERYKGYDGLEFDATDGRPWTHIANARKHAAMIQFLEQSFEWENLTYVLYPYLWAAGDRWDELRGIESSDPDYARFLRAGSARVVLSARPGHARQVLYFLGTGKPWGGGPAPAPGSAAYVSVAKEIQAQTGAPDDGEPVGDSWEVRLPTTLVWLDPDPVLPKTNAEAKFPDPPQARPLGAGPVPSTMEVGGA
ncbi:hypothetical protein Stsp02_45480 [Streptomyces sp. NBRC 14336]|uniref:hypothetical protein n=1 Tax=Streptomyces sp. NBRC 14336 TaxID=3030992 RepID=UPI00249FFEE9|nr:hypothetical protein [Streptomyces sp. NBRC 14336]WBO75905.1 hypothetical protein SBE_006647 [Streptomyces sp. SBE_14.2]GLW48886.1 hypothetical protein Stsp02_45480 [Streptomyces sp. NBRC 14336]